MEVFVLWTMGDDVNRPAQILGLFYSDMAARKFAAHFKYDDYTIEAHTIQTLNNWK